MNNKKWVLLLPAYISIMVSCSTKNCHIDYVRFKHNDTPFIYILSQSNNCEFLFKGDFWLDGRHLESKGTLTLDSGAFFLETKEFGRVRYFDFLKDSGEVYSINVNYKGQLSNIQVKIENVITDQNGIDFYVYRFYKSFHIDKHSSDLVFIVSKENGIVGSYISEINEETEYVVQRRGNILDNYIDYSRKEFRKIE